MDMDIDQPQAPQAVQQTSSRPLTLLHKLGYDAFSQPNIRDCLDSYLREQEQEDVYQPLWELEQLSRLRKSKFALAVKKASSAFRKSWMLREIAEGNERAWQTEAPHLSYAEWAGVTPEEPHPQAPRHFVWQVYGYRNFTFRKAAVNVLDWARKAFRVPRRYTAPPPPADPVSSTPMISLVHVPLPHSALRYACSHGTLL